MSDADEKLLGQIDHITSIMEARGFPDTAAFVRRVGVRLAAVEAENEQLRREPFVALASENEYRRRIANLTAELDQARQALQRVKDARDSILADVNQHAVTHPQDQRFRDGAMHAWAKLLNVPLAGPVGVPAEQPEQECEHGETEAHSFMERRQRDHVARAFLTAGDVMLSCPGPVAEPLVADDGLTPRERQLAMYDRIAAADPQED